jgi:hypothetical protein
MTSVTTICVGLVLKLPLVHVFVACGTGVILDRVPNGAVPLDVALYALEAGVPGLQGKAGVVVLCRPESRRLETMNVVASGAIAPDRAIGELPPMRILSVAIAAFPVGNGILESAPGVA